VNYDYIVMRPPTRRGADRKHVLKAWELLGHGGTLVALTSPTWLEGDASADVAFRDFVDGVDGYIKPIPEGVILVLRKPALPDDD
jgi:hypothetical protein